jgi:hypothetical protein
MLQERCTYAETWNAKLLIKTLVICTAQQISIILHFPWNFLGASTQTTTIPATTNYHKGPNNSYPFPYPRAKALAFEKYLRKNHPRSSNPCRPSLRTGPSPKQQTPRPTTLHPRHRVLWSHHSKHLFLSSIFLFRTRNSRIWSRARRLRPIYMRPGGRCEDRARPVDKRAGLCRRC